MSLDKIKKLRETTSLGISECKKALAEAKGDFDQAMAILKKRGIEVIEKKKTRTTSQGLIESYVHFGGNLGVLVEVNCETDFVARTDIFKKFAKDLAMHIAAASPVYLKKEDVPGEVLAQEKDKDQFIKESCLFSQSFVKDTSLTIDDYLKQVVAQTGENVVIKRFVRFALGESNEAQV